MEKSCKKKRIAQSGLVFLLFLLICVQVLQAHAAESVYKSGYVYLKIAGGDKSSNIQIHIWKTADFTHDDLKYTETTWNVEISAETNNHNVKLLKSKVQTVQDNRGDYYVIPIPISWTLPANHGITGQTLTSALAESEGRCGLYVSQNGSKYTSAGCVDSNTKKSNYLMLNTLQLGLRTLDNVRYNTSPRAVITMNINRPKYTVTFNAGAGTSWGSTSQKTATVARGNTATITSPTKEGYTFNGWDKTLTNVKANITTNAKWTANTYTCNFHANGGDGTMDAQEIDYAETVLIKKNTFQRNGYKFAGWSTEKHGDIKYKDEASITMNSISGINLYAVWQKEGIISNFDDVIEDDDMFTDDDKLVGGNGTTYDKRHTDSGYAHTDEEDDPGYFTGK